MNKKKKNEIIATVCLPIEIDKNAILRAKEVGIIRTSTVQDVISISKKRVKFETRNSIYDVKIYKQSFISKVLDAFKLIRIGGKRGISR